MVAILFCGRLAPRSNRPPEIIRERPMAETQADPRMQALEARMAAANLRGQWQIDASRPQNVRRGGNGQVFIEPMPAGIPHVWRWADMQQILQHACEAMTESNTARRALMFTNPK